MIRPLKQAKPSAIRVTATKGLLDRSLPAELRHTRSSEPGVLAPQESTAHATTLRSASEAPSPKYLVPGTRCVELAERAFHRVQLPIPFLDARFAAILNAILE
jgi:hypothetical protein